MASIIQLALKSLMCYLGFGEVTDGFEFGRRRNGEDVLFHLQSRVSSHSEETSSWMTIPKGNIIRIEKTQHTHAE